MRSLAIATFVACVTLHVAPAHAQVARIDHAKAGRIAFESGRYRDSLDHYQRAYEASGAPILLYNIGQAADRLRLDATTLRAFQLYLQRYPDAPNRDEVGHRIAVLEPLVDLQAKALAEQRLRLVNPRPSASAMETLTPSPYTDARRSSEPALDYERPRRAPPRDRVLESPWFWSAVALVAISSVLVVGIVASD